MEAISAAQSDHLVASLDFRLKDDSASYVIDRQEVSFFRPLEFLLPDWRESHQILPLGDWLP